MERPFTLEDREVVFDLKRVQPHIKGRRVLVTGAGGSIGSELCRQVLRCDPAQLLMLGRGENSIFEINSELRKNTPRNILTTIIADIRDRGKLRQVYEHSRPQVVFHAAAHKHVHLMEQHPDEAVKNNIFGTLNVAEVSLEYGAEEFVLISSDKAVNPTSVYGVSKKVAEFIVQDLARRQQTKFAVVRIGNITRSRGSIIPILESQICAGGPVTITHVDAQRYFMNIPEAAYLILQVGGIAQNGQICVLDMGEPVRIIDLAHNLIKAAGMRPGVDIEIEITGLKAGEKLSEELAVVMGDMQPTRCKKILLDRPDDIDLCQLRNGLDALHQSVKAFDRKRTIEHLQRLVPTYVAEV